MVMHEIQTPCLRMAIPSDVDGLYNLFDRCGNRNLHARTREYFASMIQKNAIVVQVGTRTSTTNHQQGSNFITTTIDACLECLVVKSRDEIRSFCSIYTPDFTLPHQPNDTLVYLGGLLKDKTKEHSKHFLPMATQFLRKHLETDRWTEKYQQWHDRQSPLLQQRQQQKQDNDNSTVTTTATISIEHRYPGRTIFLFGLMGGAVDHARSINVFERAMDLLWPQRGEPYVYARKSQSPDGSGQTATVYFYIHHPPLTRHQMERTKRNRYLITDAEQRRLVGTRVGFVGLSTGSVAMEALLRQGVGGIYRIADFDVFETSNSNRMLYGTQQVGESKVKLCADRIRSVDPAIGIEEYPEGLKVCQDTIDAFVQDCDIVVEECDDFAVKAMVRVAAKKYRRPVVMATSQNGMIDVERYDVDEIHTRPFHLDDVTVLEKVTTNTKLSASDKNQLISHLYDFRSVSPRFIGSGIEIGRSISSWPQLAEEVFLNAASLTHAARRILLGDTELVSGRFSMRMDRLFTPFNRIATRQPVQFSSPGLTEYPRPEFAVDQSHMERLQQLLFVAYWANTAPSGGNQQPWSTRVTSKGNGEPRLEIFFRKGAASVHELKTILKEKWFDIALGCVLENTEIAAAHLGFSVKLLDGINSDISVPVAACLVLTKWDIQTGPLSLLNEKKRLFPAMRYRASCRSSKPIETIPSKLRHRLDEMGVVIAVETANDGSPTIETVRSAIVEERKRRLDDLQGIFDEVQDGPFKIHPKVLGLSDEETRALQALSNRPDVIDFVSKEGFHKSLFLDPFKAEIQQYKVFLILVHKKENDAVAKGRFLERVWLETTHHGLGARPFSLASRIMKSVGVPNAFFVLSLAEPHNLPVASSRL